MARARSALEEEQRQAYAVTGRAPKAYAKEDLERANREARAADEEVLAGLTRFPGTTEAEIQRLRAQLSERRRQLEAVKRPTRFEDPVLYTTIQIIMGQMNAAAGEFQKSHPGSPRVMPDLRRVLVGTLPSGSINASETVVNPDEATAPCRVYRVLLDTGFLQFAEAFSSMLVRPLAPAEAKGRFLGVDLNSGAVESYLDAHAEIAVEFERLLRSYLLQGYPVLAAGTAAAARQEPAATIAAMMYRAMIIFALGHELGHVVYAQHELREPPGQQLPGGWSEEYFADGWGVMLCMVAAGRNIPVEFAILGASLYFICYDLIERGVSLVSTGEDYRASAGHPPAHLRRGRIPRYVVAVLHDFFNKEPASSRDLDGLVAPARNVEAAMDSLWRRVKPGVRRLYLDKVRLAPSWRGLVPAEAGH
jgi:hypothetical protein